MNWRSRGKDQEGGNKVERQKGEGRRGKERGEKREEGRREGRREKREEGRREVNGEIRGREVETERGD